MGERRRVYIAGPMSGLSGLNHERFEQVAQYWEGKLGYDAYLPFEANSVVWRKHYGRNFNPYCDRCDYGDPLLREMFAEDIKLMLTCDTLVLLDGWEQSRGAKREEYVARLFDMPVFDERGNVIGENVRVFETGATRDVDEDKLDYEGFISPLALERFAEYMHEHRTQRDGSLRASDNWQKGIPLEAYMKSLWRHFMDLWKAHRGWSLLTPKGIEDALCAILFNTQGYLHEVVRSREQQP